LDDLEASTLSRIVKATRRLVAIRRAARYHACCRSGRDGARPVVGVGAAEPARRSPPLDIGSGPPPLTQPVLAGIVVEKVVAEGRFELPTKGL
jgi:hypothetical protein